MAEDDPAAAFLQREHDELGDIGDEILGQPVGQSESTNEEQQSEEFTFGGQQDEEESQPYDPYGAIAHVDVQAAEPECIRRWRQEQEERLAKKDASEQEAIEDLRRQARQELEDMYKHMDEQLDQTRIANKEAQEAFIAERDGDEPGHEWERVSKMCDFSGKGSKCTKDVTRMRSIFIHLKQEPLVR